MRKINSMVGLKAIMMLALFWWHSWLKNPAFDVGARMCELLFVISGFLVSYNHFYKKQDYTWEYSIQYTKKRFIQMWPLHVVAFLTTLLASVQPLFTDKIEFVYAALNLSLLQAWFGNERIFFSYNGVSWFLSALLFCYFISPLLLWSVKKVKRIWILLPLTTAVRLFVEYMQIKEPEAFGYVVHCNPIIRGMEFFIGLMLGVCFLKLYEQYQKVEFHSKQKFLLFSVLEIFAVIGYMGLVYRYDGIWMRGQYVLLACIPVFVFAFDEGICSKVLSLKVFKWFGNIQFEFYILHMAIISLVQKYVGVYTEVIWIKTLLAFVMICVFGAVWHRYLLKPVSSWIEKIFGKIDSMLD